MGWLSSGASFTLKVAVDTAKGGAKFVWWGTKKAGKGTVWVVKKAAVDPAKRKIINKGLVPAEAFERVTRGECAACGKKFHTKGGKFQFCSTACSLSAFESWSSVKTEKVNVHAKDTGDGLYYPCGVHNKNAYADFQHDQICGG
jgi:endogenous inhibitor of DNA gyrase (YacG/DUF329 family)